MKREKEMKHRAYRRLVIGDALAVNKLQLSELKLLMTGFYYLHIMPEVLDEVHNDYQDILLMTGQPAKLKVEQLSAVEKINATQMQKYGRSLTDQCAVMLAKRLKAFLFVGDPYWYSQQRKLEGIKLLYSVNQLFVSVPEGCQSARIRKTSGDFVRKSHTQRRKQ